MNAVNASTWSRWPCLTSDLVLTCDAHHLLSVWLVLSWMRLINYTHTPLSLFPSPSVSFHPLLTSYLGLYSLIDNWLVLRIRHRDSFSVNCYFCQWKCWLTDFKYQIWALRPSRLCCSPLLHLQLLNDQYWFMWSRMTPDNIEQYWTWSHRHETVHSFMFHHMKLNSKFRTFDRLQLTAHKINFPIVLKCWKCSLCIATFICFHLLPHQMGLSCNGEEEKEMRRVNSSGFMMQA